MRSVDIRKQGYDIEARCRKAYLESHPLPPGLPDPLSFELFGADGRLSQIALQGRRVETTTDALVLVNSSFGIDLVLNKQIFIALYHLIAGPVACADLPKGAYACGGCVTACVALPRMGFWAQCDATPPESERLAAAGLQIGRYLADCRFWQTQARKVLDRQLGSDRLPAPAFQLISTFAGLDKQSQPLMVRALLRDYQLVDDDGLPTALHGFGKWMHEDGTEAYAKTDIDFYITGESLSETSDRFMALLEELRTVLPVSTTAIQTPNTVTFCPDFPGRHVQIVSTVHVDVDSILLFADLDCTTLAYDGKNVRASHRFMRALAAQQNQISVGMWLRRADTLKRAGKYVPRGWGVALRGADGWSSQDIKMARSRVGHVAHERKRFYAVSDEEEIQAGMHRLQTNNTAYNEYRIPRGPGVSAAKIEQFLQALGADDKIYKGRPVACEWRLARKPEDWVMWELVPRS